MSEFRFSALLIFTCLAGLDAAAPREASAEGTGGREQMTGTPQRVHGAAFIKPVAGGLATVGGSRLRYLPPDAKTWTTLYTKQGNLSRLGLDDDGARLMAVWEQDPTLHLFGLRNRLHETFPLPDLGSTPAAQFLYVHSLAFTPDGNGALVFLTGPARRNGPYQASQAFRTGFGPGSKPEMLWEAGDTSDLVWTCGRGAVYIVPKDPDAKGHWKASLTGQLTAFDLTQGQLNKRTIYADPNNKFRSARVASGSTPDRLILLLTTGRGGHGLITYRWGDDGGTYVDLPPGPGPTIGPVLAPETDEVVYLVDRGLELDIVRQGLPPSTQTTSTRIWPITSPDKRRGRRTLASSIYGMGVRINGGVWIHFGDDLALIGTDGTIRRARLPRLSSKNSEWAGSAVYVKAPEALWIGVEVGAGRDWIRVPFNNLEHSATPWPKKDDRIPPVSAEQVDDRERMTKCLPPNTRISTPAGEIPIKALQAGMPIWTRDNDGRRIAGIVLKVARRPAAPGQRIVQLKLADGRSLDVSAGHPVPAGFGAEKMTIGEAYDGSTIRSIQIVSYAGTETLDLLPSGETGEYWANGIPLASTLTPVR